MAAWRSEVLLCLALPAFLASAASTSDSDFASFSNTWASNNNLPCPNLPLASRQKTWDRPCIEANKATILSSAPDNHHRARLLAISAPHAGDWLHALPISSCGLRLDEFIRVVVGLRLGINLCQPRQCPCGSQVDTRGTHGLACKQSSGRTVRHPHINDLVWHSLLRAGIPSSKEPSGLSRSDGKRPDGITLIPWQAGKTFMWDVTVIDTLANSYLSINREVGIGYLSDSQQSGGASKSASSRKEAK